MVLCTLTIRAASLASTRVLYVPFREISARLMSLPELFDKSVGWSLILFSQQVGEQVVKFAVEYLTGAA